MTDIDDYITTLRKSQLKRTTVIADVDKIISENKRLKHDVGNLGYKIKNQRKEIERQIAQNAQLKSKYEKECRRADEVEDSYWKAEKENQKLKELLGECLAHLSNGELGASVTPLNFVIEKIKEVLK